MRLQFRGPVTVIKQDEDGEHEQGITSPDALKALDGKIHDSQIAEFLFDGSGTEGLKPLNITGGFLSLYLHDDVLYVYVSYDMDVMPDEEQLGVLWDYTQGQLYDGAGPDFAGACEEETGLYPVLESSEFEYGTDAQE